MMGTLVVREKNLAAILPEDIDPQDYIRTVTQKVSTNISFIDMCTAIKPLLEGMNFLTVESSPAGFSQIRTLKTITSNYTITDADSVILCDTTAGNITITLPTAASVWDDTGDFGQQFSIKRVSSDNNSVIINGATGEYVDSGVYTLTGPNLTSATLISDGFDWWVL